MSRKVNQQPASADIGPETDATGDEECYVQAAGARPCDGHRLACFGIAVGPTIA
jgi:hypothetical protein